MLTSLEITGVSLTATNERLLNEFYRPAFSQCSLYQRGVAYFSIQFYLRLMDSIVDFVQNGGNIQLVTSVQLDEQTANALAEGFLLSDYDVERRLQGILEAYQISSDEDEVKLDVIANLIAARRLMMKVAYVPTNGIYHEKIGIFTDDEGNSISFIGSANATINAFNANFETVNHFPSWHYPLIVEEHRIHFRRLWNNEVADLKVIPFPEAVENNLLATYKKSATVESAIARLRGVLAGKSQKGDVRPKLRTYQNKAIDEFERNDFRHFFEMATGTGKTFTAIKAIERMSERHRLLNVVILVPLRDLQDQWEREVRKNMTVPHRVFKFGGGGQSEIGDFNLSSSTGYVQGGSFISMAICVYKKFFSEIYESISPIDGDVLILVDEAHNLTPNQLQKLEGLTSYRLGLSATPQRYSRKETQLVLDYFLLPGEESFKFDLKAAMDAGFLAKYRYYPIPVSLTLDEYESYGNFSHRIAVAQSVYDNDPSKVNKKKLDDLKIQRSLIVKKAINKLSVLERLVDSDEYEFHNAVVFCGPGAMSAIQGESPLPVVDCVTRILSSNPRHRYFPAKFTSSVDSDRAIRLEHFKEGITDTLVAIKCFDEGMDVPALDKIYIMASDSSLRQTIQRRGRVLRVSKETGKVDAKIYDFVAGFGEGEHFIPLPNDCCRVNEYARLSLNPEASDFLLKFFHPGDPDGDFDDELNEEDE